MKLLLKLLASITAASIILCGCTFDPETGKITGTLHGANTETKEIFAMDTYMTVTAAGDRAKEAVSAAVDEITRLDKLLSAESPESEIYALNHNGKGTLSEDALIMVKKAIELYYSTNGAYDITVYPLMELWGFTTDTPALPDDLSVKDTLMLCGTDKIQLSNNFLTLGKGQGIDLGSIAKGYTSSKIMDIFDEYGINSGVVSLGGNVQCYHNKPDGTKWRCGITDPDNPDSQNSFPGIVTVSDKAVITSGDYERFFVDEKSRKHYHHIMDPRTGYPADNGLRSVTVVSEDGMLADALSTACFVMGKDAALKFWSENSDSFDLILISSDGSITITNGLADSFSSEKDYEVFNL